MERLGLLAISSAFVIAGRNLINDRARMAARRHEKRAVVSSGVILQAIAVAGGVDQLLSDSLGASGAAVVQIVLSLLGQHLQGESDAIRRLEQKVDSTLNGPYRVASDSFAEAVALANEGNGRERFRDADERIQIALSYIEEQHERGVMSGQDHRSLIFLFEAVHALCAKLSGDEAAAQYRLRLCKDIIRRNEEADATAVTRLHAVVIPDLEREKSETLDALVVAKGQDFRSFGPPNALSRTIYRKRLKEDRDRLAIALADARGQLERAVAATQAYALMSQALTRAICEGGA